MFGIFAAPKLLWIGGGVAVFSLLAFFYLQPYLSLCIAITGGGGLIAGGLWLRRL